MTMHKRLLAAMIVLAGAGVLAGEEIPIDKLPKVIFNALKARFPKATLESAAFGEYDGKKVYEVEIENGTVSLDITLSLAGKILMIEKEIEVKDLPKAVAATLKAKFPKATIEEVSEVTEGSEISYEVTLTTGKGSMMVVTFSPRGKILEVEKVDEKKKEEKKESK